MFKAGLLLTVAIIASAFPAYAVDEKSAEALARESNCLKCHSVSRAKEGPSFKTTAEKYKGKAGAVDEVIKHMTSGKDVKLADGTSEKHKIAKTMPANDKAQLKNLAEYVLSIQPK